MLPGWVAQQEPHSLSLRDTDNAKNNLSIPALSSPNVPSFHYGMYMTISSQWDSAAYVDDCNGKHQHCP